MMEVLRKKSLKVKMRSMLEDETVKDESFKKNL